MQFIKFLTRGMYGPLLTEWSIQMTSLLLWTEILSMFLYVPFAIGLMVGITWAVKIRKWKGPPIKIMYEVDIDSVKL